MFASSAIATNQIFRRRLEWFRGGGETGMFLSQPNHSFIISPRGISRTRLLRPRNRNLRAKTIAFIEISTAIVVIAFSLRLGHISIIDVVSVNASWRNTKTRINNGTFDDKFIALIVDSD
jgi:hypothetical protein